jgi:hypothetical protein
LFALPAAEFAAVSLPLDPSVGREQPLTGLGPYVRAAFNVVDDCLVLPDLDRIAELTGF